MGMMRRWPVLFLVVSLVGTVALSDKAKQVGPTGTWKWKVTIGEQIWKMTLKLRVENDKATALVACEDRKVLVRDADFKDPKLSFKVITEQDGKKTISEYSGKVNGDEIVGEVATQRGDHKASDKWVATRVVAAKPTVAFIERRYAKQLETLAKYASNYDNILTMPSPLSDPVRRLFEDASIVSAAAYGSNGVFDKGGAAIKVSSEYLPVGAGCWFRRTPSIGKPVVNLWQGNGKQFAEYVSAVRDGRGNERSYDLVIDLSKIDDRDD